MSKAYAVYAVAKTVWDQDTHSEADLAFLAAVSRADREWLELVETANKEYGGGSRAWEAVKNLATRSRDKSLVDALAALEAADFEDEAEFLAAAE
jgi:hypothetical protein